MDNRINTLYLNEITNYTEIKAAWDQVTAGAAVPEKISEPTVYEYTAPVQVGLVSPGDMGLAIQGIGCLETILGLGAVGHIGQGQVAGGSALLRACSLHRCLWQHFGGHSPGRHPVGLGSEHR